MSFCKEFFNPDSGPEKRYPRPRLDDKKEFEEGRRAWWETGVDDTLESLRSSVRVQRVMIALLLFLILMSK